MSKTFHSLLIVFPLKHFYSLCSPSSTFLKLWSFIFDFIWFLFRRIFCPKSKFFNQLLLILSHGRSFNLTWSILWLFDYIFCYDIDCFKFFPVLKKNISCWRIFIIDDKTLLWASNADIELLKFSTERIVFFLEVISLAEVRFLKEYAVGIFILTSSSIFLSICGLFLFLVLKV